GLTGPAAGNRDDEQEREEAEHHRGGLRSTGNSGGNRDREHCLERDRPRPGNGRAAPVQPVARKRTPTPLARGELGRRGAEQDRGEGEAEKTHHRKAAVRTSPGPAS